MRLTLTKEETKIVADLSIALALQNGFEAEELKQGIIKLFVNNKEWCDRILKYSIYHFNGLFNSLAILREEGDVPFFERMTTDLVNAIGTRVKPN